MKREDKKITNYSLDKKSQNCTEFSKGVQWVVGCVGVVSCQLGHYLKRLG